MATATNLTGYAETLLGYRIELSRDWAGRYRAHATSLESAPSLFSTPNYKGLGARQAALRAIRKQITDNVTRGLIRPIPRQA